MKNKTEYQEAVTQKMPRHDDPQDIAYVAKLKQCVLRESWAQKAFETIRERQITYLREVLAQSDNAAFVYTRTQQVLEEVAELLRARIADGAKLLREIPKGHPTLLMTHHLSTYKLTGFESKKELGFAIPGYEFIHPEPVLIAGLKPIAKVLGDTLSYASADFPGVFGKIHREAGFLHIPPKETLTTGRTTYLLDETRQAFKRRPNTALVNFPEGQTSGKHTGRGPYDLDPFKTGGYVIAAELGARVIPVAQYFDPKEGLQLKVFPSYIPESSDKAAIAALADRDQRQMQEWLNERQNS